MKRDMSLIQAILEELERAETSWCDTPHTLPGYDDAARMLYHMELCVQAEFVRTWNPNQKVVGRKVQMTWSGHEHLTRIRNA